MNKMYAGAKWASAMPDAAWNPMAITGTNQPGFHLNDRELGISPLIKSHREAALIGEGYVAPNMGALPAGLVVARIAGGEKKGYLVPVDFKVTLVSASSSTTFTVKEEDAKYFAKGDDVTTFGKITDIAAPSGGTVVITGTSSGSSTNDVAFTTEKLHMVLDQAAVSDEHGAQTSMIYSNAVLYRNKLVNVTDEEIGTAGWAIDGQFAIVK